MGEILGYRLHLNSLAQLARFIETFRMSSMKAFTSDYANLVAIRSVFDMDCMMLGIKQQSANLTEIANKNVSEHLLRRNFTVNGRTLNCKISIHLVDGLILARFVSGGDVYRKILEGSKGVHRWNWHPSGPNPGLSEYEWRARGRVWDKALNSNGQGATLHLALIDGDIPPVNFEQIKLSAPSFDARVYYCKRKLAELNGLDMDTLSAEDDREITVRVKSAIPRELPQSYFNSARPNPEKQQDITRGRERTLDYDDAQGKTNLIDHADVIEASNGRVFVAVPYAALKQKARIFLQISGSCLTMIQGGTICGIIDNVSRLGLDMLRLFSTITVVEVEIANGARIIRSKHVAVVKDISIFEGGMQPLISPIRKQHALTS